LPVFSGGVLDIQDCSRIKYRKSEDIDPEILQDGKPRFSVTKEESRQFSLDSDRNRVNVGNFDSNGLNVSNDSPDNSNSILRVCVARQFSL